MISVSGGSDFGRVNASMIKVTQQWPPFEGCFGGTCFVCKFREFHTRHHRHVNHHEISKT